MGSADFKILKDIMDSLKGLSSLRVNRKPLSDISKISKNAVVCTKLGDISSKGLKNAVVSFNATADKLSGGQAVDSLVTFLKNRYDKYDSSIDGVAKEYRDFGNDLRAVVKRINDVDLTPSTSRFAKTAKKVSSHYNKLKSVVETSIGASRLGEDGKTVFSKLDSSSAKSLKESVEALHSESISILEAYSAIGVDTNRKISSEEADLLLILEGRLHDNEQKLAKVYDNVQVATNISEKLDSEARLKSVRMVESFDSYADIVSSIGASIKRGDFLSAGDGVIGLSKNFKKSSEALSAMRSGGDKELGKGMSSMSKNLIAFAAFTELFVKGIKRLIGLIMGINNYSAEFVKQLHEYHGLVSQGITLDMGLDTGGVIAKYNEYMVLMDSYGADSGTFIDRKAILEVTSAFEKEGVKLLEMSKSREHFNKVMSLVLNVAPHFAMSSKEVSSIIGDWQVNLGMDLNRISVFLDRLGDAQGTLGVPARMLFETIKSANADYSVWAESMLVSMRMTERNIKKMGLSYYEATEGMKMLVSHVDSSMSAKNWSALFKVAPEGYLDELIRDEISVLEEMGKSAKTDHEKAAVSFQISPLKAALNYNYYEKIEAFAASSSPTHKLEALRKILPRHLGDRYMKGLELGVFPEDIRHKLAGLAGFKGYDPGQWMMLTRSLKALGLDKYNYREEYHKIVKITGAKTDFARHKFDENKALYQSMTESKGFLHSYLNKFLAGFNAKAKSILGTLNAFWISDNKQRMTKREAEAQAAKKAEVASTGGGNAGMAAGVSGSARGFSGGRGKSRKKSRRKSWRKDTGVSPLPPEEKPLSDKEFKTKQFVGRRKAEDLMAIREGRLDKIKWTTIKERRVERELKKPYIPPKKVPKKPVIKNWARKSSVDGYTPKTSAGIALMAALAQERTSPYIGNIGAGTSGIGAGTTPMMLASIPGVPNSHASRFASPTSSLYTTAAEAMRLYGGKKGLAIIKKMTEAFKKGKQFSAPGRKGASRRGSQCLAGTGWGMHRGAQDAGFLDILATQIGKEDRYDNDFFYTPDPRQRAVTMIPKFKAHPFYEEFVFSSKADLKPENIPEGTVVILDNPERSGGGGAGHIAYKGKGSAAYSDLEGGAPSFSANVSGIYGGSTPIKNYYFFVPVAVADQVKKGKRGSNTNYKNTASGSIMPSAAQYKAQYNNYGLPPGVKPTKHIYEQYRKKLNKNQSASSSKQFNSAQINDLSLGRGGQVCNINNKEVSVVGSLSGVNKDYARKIGKKFTRSGVKYG
jgi:hypothetical protein